MTSLDQLERRNERRGQRVADEVKVRPGPQAEVSPRASSQQHGIILLDGCEDRYDREAYTRCYWMRLSRYSFGVDAVFV